MKTHKQNLNKIQVFEEIENKRIEESVSNAIDQALILTQNKSPLVKFLTAVGFGTLVKIAEDKNSKEKVKEHNKKENSKSKGLNTIYLNNSTKKKLKAK